MKFNFTKSFILVVVILFAFLLTPTVKGLAEENESIVATNIKMGYSSDGNTLPSLLNDSYVYTVSVYKEDGQTLIAENISTYKYKFPEPGTFVLKWYLENIVTGETITASSTLFLKDVVVPTLLLNGGYDTFYSAGTELEILGVSILDDSGENIADYTTSVLCNGKNIPIPQNGRLVLEKGEYQIIYKAKDATGNEGTLDIYFNVGETSNQQATNPTKKGCGSVISMGMLSSSTLFVVGMFLMKKKEII